MFDLFFFVDGEPYVDEINIFEFFDVKFFGTAVGTKSVFGLNVIAKVDDGGAFHVAARTADNIPFYDHEFTAIGAIRAFHGDGDFRMSAPL